METGKKEDLLKKCLTLVEEAEDILQCPICCKLSSAVVEQCAVGHHVCKECKEKLNECPTCKSPFTGTKSFIAPDLNKVFSNMKISMTSLDKSESVGKYRRGKVKILLNDLSSFLNKFSSSLIFLSDYVKDPVKYDAKQLEFQMVSLTSQFQRMKVFMNDLEKSLK